MNINKKIEEIRRKPEYIRRRYVTFFVFISMVFMVFLWFFSLKETLGRKWLDKDFLEEIKNKNDISPMENLNEQLKRKLPFEDIENLDKNNSATESIPHESGLENNSGAVEK